MKIYLHHFSLIVFAGLLLASCGPNEKEIRAQAEKEIRAQTEKEIREKIEQERQDSIKAAEALRLEEERKYPHDGLYEWIVEFSDFTGELYGEEIGCEISKGEVVSATWYSAHDRSPMTGTLNGNILHLKGNNVTYPALWMECEVDLRTGRGKAANNFVPNAEAKFRKNN